MELKNKLIHDLKKLANRLPIDENRDYIEYLDYMELEGILNILNVDLEEYAFKYGNYMQVSLLKCEIEQILIDEFDVLIDFKNIDLDLLNNLNTNDNDLINELKSKYEILSTHEDFDFINYTYDYNDYLTLDSEDLFIIVMDILNNLDVKAV